MPTNVILIIAIPLTVFIAIILIYKFFYRKGTVDAALVVRKRKKVKVTIGRGAFVSPFAFWVRKVSLNLMPVPIQRGGKDALITCDFSLADVDAVFHLRVKPDTTSMIKVLNSLGEKVISPDTLQELLEPKLDAALRSVAAETPLPTLHRETQTFADAVKEKIAENLLEENGLLLESVSITHLGQTPIAYLSSDDRFNAAGLEKIREAGLTARVELERLARIAEDSMKKREKIRSYQEAIETIQKAM